MNKNNEDLFWSLVSLVSSSISLVVAIIVLAIKC